MNHAIEPLVDLEARILCVSATIPTTVVVDRLLRLQSGRDWQRPIWLYLPGADGPGTEAPTLSAMDFLTLHAIFRSLRSPVHGVGLGLLRGFEPLLLAACQPGHRYLLPSALCYVGALAVDRLPFSHELGLAVASGASLREQAAHLIRGQLDSILAQLQTPASLWQGPPRLFSAQACIAAGLADRIVPVADRSLTLNPNPDHDPELRYHPLPLTPTAS